MNGRRYEPQDTEYTYEVYEGLLKAELPSYRGTSFNLNKYMIAFGGFCFAMGTGLGTWIGVFMALYNG